MSRSRTRLLPLALICALTAFFFGLGLGLADNAWSPLEVFGASGERAQAQSNRSATLPQSAPADSPRHTRVVDVARQVSPAVVSIGVTRRRIERLYPGWDDFFFPPIISRETEREFPYLGSGFIIDRQGHILTNYHVVENASSIFVTLTDGRSYDAQLLDADTHIDIALLKIEDFEAEGELPVMPLGDSDDIMIGETVLAIGNPYGPLIADPRPSVSTGVVSAVKRSFRLRQVDPSRAQVHLDMIQTDAAINPGNSGGPLVNLAGDAIGINTFIFSRSGGSDNIGFSIPINRAKRIVDEILRYGKVRDIRLDFEAINVSPHIRQLLDLNVNRGVLINKLETDGPARRAGIELGDVIVAIEGKPVHDTSDLLNQILARTVGENIELTINRKGKNRNITYTITAGGGTGDDR